MRLIRPTTIAQTGAFSRATTGTYIDSGGVIQTAAINALRYTHNPNTLANEGALFESAATNLLLHSAADTTTGWTLASNLTRVGNTTAPDGTNTATVYANPVAGNAYILQTVGIAASTTYTVSIWARLITGSVPSAGGLILVDYDADGNGAVLERAALPFTDLTTSWKRFSVTASNVSACTANVFLCKDFGNGANIAVWGAQLEVGAKATSYIPTTTATVTRAADVNTAMLLSDVPETDYPAWVGGSTYTTLTSYVVYAHKIYQCLVTHTTAAQPDTNTSGATPKWLDCGFDNRWKMFDAVVGSQTSQAESITVVLTPGLIDSIAFLDTEAVTIGVVMTDPTEGVVYSESINMITKSYIVDAYSYFFEPIILSDSVVLLGIPAYPNASITITITNLGGTAKVGTLVVGAQKDIGGTQQNPQISIADYSRKDVDDFGNYTIVQRAYSKRLTCETWIPNTMVDEVQRTLALYRATPVVWVGTDDGTFSSMIIYGFYKSFSISIPYPDYSTCNLEIEGLS